MNSNNETNNVQAYRMTTLGYTLQETLDELLQNGSIKEKQAKRIFEEFDKSINKALSTRIKNKVNFKSSKLDIYRNCDNVWTLVFNGMNLQNEGMSPIKLETDTKIKIVACESGRNDKKTTKTTQQDDNN